MKKDDKKQEKMGEIQREEQLTNTWIPEKNAVTGFTLKGMGMLILAVIIIFAIKLILGFF